VDAAERIAFVRRACLGDDELFREVERLLIAHERVDRGIEAPVTLTALPDPDDDVVPRMEGRRIGPYEVLRELGRGGMGVVYLGSRVDAAYQKLVAIKIVRPALATAAVLRRFNEERQILASLDHPNIARLFDGGTTEDGLPYLIMEYVEGQAIDSWCNGRRLNVTRRLELFRSGCSAVQYAHQHMIVHLDLKPSNILVIPDGTVKLLDFGIAKLLHRTDTGAAVASLTLRPRMTPEYASPEQVTGAPVSSASDVYSLGVVLYELLTGHRPYRMNTRILHEIARVICEEEPAQPSTIVTETEDLFENEMTSARLTPNAVSEVREGNPGRLSRRLQGDLDNILLLSLQKEPVRRYGSVEAFDDDLRRHLEGLPIRARPNTIAYRFQKFVRRNPAGVAAALFVIATIFAGIATTLWQERLAIRGQQRSVLLPQLALYTYVNIAIFVVAAYLTRATLRRLAGAAAGATAYVIVGFLLAREAFSVGWWRFALTDMPPVPRSLFAADVLCYAATLALVSWRITRRFGWRGQAAVIGLAGVWGPARDYLGAMMTELIVIAPGWTPVLGWAMCWALSVAVMQGVMRLVAGPARSDLLAKANRAGRTSTA
jgi:serine/threonine protein kinase